MRVVVCGTRFGRVYLAGLRRPDLPFELAGVLARGSQRSRACAEHDEVPLYTDPGQLPGDVDIACVVVSAGVNGGRGAELAQQLMARGIHVLQEHPLHHDELAGCLRAARRHGVVYHLNTHYPHLVPVRRFLVAAQELLGRQRPLFVDATVAFQVAYSGLDILGRALGRLRPWAFAEPADPQRLRAHTELDVAFRSLDGVLAGVPCTLRIQHQLDPIDPDNHAHLLHRITIGTEGGTLTLANTHGPLLWSPRPHLPADAAEAVLLHALDEGHLDLPSTTVLGPAEAPCYREVLRTTWPAGVARALLELRSAVLAGEDPLRRGQYYLTLCRLWQELSGQLGPVELLHRDVPVPLGASVLAAAAARVEDDEDERQRI